MAISKQQPMRQAEIEILEKVNADDARLTALEHGTPLGSNCYIIDAGTTGQETVPTLGGVTFDIDCEPYDSDYQVLYSVVCHATNVTNTNVISFVVDKDNGIFAVIVKNLDTNDVLVSIDWAIVGRI